MVDIVAPDPNRAHPAPAPQSGAHVIELRVRYAETDQMGIVYHANFLVWCEMGRVEWLRSRGVAYAELERSGTGLAVVEASLRFRSPARYDDRVRVTTQVTAVRSRAVSFSYRIERLGDGSVEPLLLATAETALMGVDSAGRQRSLPRSLLASLRDYAAPNE